jgi:hypothetical protein
MRLMFDEEEPMAFGMLRREVDMANAPLERNDTRSRLVGRLGDVDLAEGTAVLLHPGGHRTRVRFPHDLATLAQAGSSANVVATGVFDSHGAFVIDSIDPTVDYYRNPTADELAAEQDVGRLRLNDLPSVSVNEEEIEEIMADLRRLRGR